MKPKVDLDEMLELETLRIGFLKYTRKAFARLPELDRPRILDIGCGSGLPTIELARLSNGEVVGIDTNGSELAELQRRIEDHGLQPRVKAVHVSLLETRFEPASFDLLWDEGTLHLTDPKKSLPVCRHLLRPNGFLVMHETIAWFEGVMVQLSELGFEVFDRLPLPSRCWWTDYYAPLEERIQALGVHESDVVDAERLAQIEREIAMVQADPERFDCDFFIARKVEGAASC
ncbi:MAG: class I SAM-dependent methyltransferase [Bradymonadales bacterium]|nr:class I SAM-dependent methyltransferase [Bradymonadales bacterium]